MDLLVAADDRTGALETAGVLADRLATPVGVSAWPSRPAAGRVGVTVVDLGSRHLSAVDARARIGGLPANGRIGHKLDSTLRGNWPDELAAWAARRPVLLVPALPDQGRTCEGGIVLEHGRPVHEGHVATDVRRSVSSSRPADLLRRAGLDAVAELADQQAIESWLAAPVGVAVADAASDDDIASIVSAWTGSAHEVVLAGTSAVIGAAAPGGGATPARPTTDGPILVACGSVHPTARAQLDGAERVGITIATIADDITAHRLRETGELILATEIPVGDVDEPLAVAAASSLASGVAELRRRVALGALVVVGGDTAAAVFGSAAVSVRGTVAAGTAWASADGFDMPVITRSGGFGSDRSLVDLIRKTLRP